MARRDRVVVHDLGEDVVVFDQDRAVTHCLNRTAALVWQHCDGETSIAALAALLHDELQLPADEDLVWLALDRLDKTHLLRDRLERPATGPRVSRRQVIRRLGVAGGLALLVPVVTSIVAPTPAQALSAVAIAKINRFVCIARAATAAACSAAPNVCIEGGTCQLDTAIDTCNCL